MTGGFKITSGYVINSNLIYFFQINSPILVEKCPEMG